MKIELSPPAAPHRSAKALSPSLSLLLFLAPLLFPAAGCSAPLPARGTPSARSRAGCASPAPVLLLEGNALCFPAALERMGPDGAVEKLPAPGPSSPSLLLEKPGTWLYMGHTPQGTVEALVQKGAATPLPAKTFGAPLEIRPETHPVDVIPSPDRMSRDAWFSFTVLEGGKPCAEPVRYTASLLGRSAGPPAEGKTDQGRGRIFIDAPGLWWITAEKAAKAGGRLMASLTFSASGAPGPDDYSAFTSGGTPLADADAVAERLAGAQVIFLGEKHDDPVAHLLEKEILAAVHRKKGDVALSMEMFERDVQAVLDGYLAGRYRESQFLAASRPWPRYATDYRPMVEYARRNGLPVIAANAPRRLVNFVTRKGPDALAGLPGEELKWLPPLPYHVPTEGRYVEKLKGVFSQMGAQGGGKKGKPLPGPRTKRDWRAKGSPSLAAYDEMLRAAGAKKKPGAMSGGGPHGGMMPPVGMLMKKKGFPSQSLWDASMAHSIAAFLDSHPGTTVVQVNGSFHSDEFLGTVAQLLRYRPGVKVAVVSMVPDDAFPAFDEKALGKLGDVVIVTNPKWQKKAEEE